MGTNGKRIPLAEARRMVERDRATWPGSEDQDDAELDLVIAILTHDPDAEPEA